MKEGFTWSVILGRIISVVDPITAMRGDNINKRGPGKHMWLCPHPSKGGKHKGGEIIYYL